MTIFLAMWVSMVFSVGITHEVCTNKPAIVKPVKKVKKHFHTLSEFDR